MALTERQRKILEYIKDNIRREGYPPTIREIAEKFSFDSTGTVRDHLTALARKGVIRRVPGLSRGIKLIQRKGIPAGYVSSPRVGRIVAGKPELAVEEIQGTLSVDKSLAKGEKTFALRVEGDSMIGRGIYEGDYVVVRSQPAAEQGDIVVALIDDEAAVKRFHRKGKSIQLLSANPGYPPIEVDQKLKIIGKVVGLIRYYP